ncbi:hypothetical protein [Vibrio sp. WXL103]|uniref:hypothetical protein n=1 Tax=unclassified Vibrio TaxID=2614977 RepID=UPI003EC797F3
MNKLARQALLLSILLVSQYTTACLLHPGFSQQGNAPEGATWVVIETQMAMQSGALTPTALQDGLAGFQQVTWWLRLLAQQMSQLDEVDVYLYVSDIELWAKYRRDNQMIEVYEDKPDISSNSMLILTRQTLHALVSKQLTLVQGEKMNIIRRTQ